MGELYCNKGILYKYMMLSMDTLFRITPGLFKGVTGGIVYICDGCIVNEGTIIESHEIHCACSDHSVHILSPLWKHHPAHQAVG
jgi:hypothetical protein